MGGIILVSLLAAGNASATDVEFSDETGIAGQQVVVTFTFTGDGNLEGLQAEALISDPSVFSSIDASSLCSGASSVIVSCQLSGDGQRLQVTAANGPGVPLGSFSGTAVFTIDGAAVPTTVVNLEWDSSDPDFTPTTFADGSITVVDANAVLDVAPQSLNFGSEFVGGTTASQAVTISNDGSDGDRSGSHQHHRDW
jgi:hypothetical protein